MEKVTEATKKLKWGKYAGHDKITSGVKKLKIQKYVNKDL